MATAEDLRQLFEQNAMFMQQLQEQQHAHMNQMFEEFIAAALPASHERRFRELGSCGQLVGFSGRRLHGEGGAGSKGMLQGSVTDQDR